MITFAPEFINKRKMKKIFIINGGQKFHGGGGTLNASITEWTRQTLEELSYQVHSTCINDTYDPRAEAEKIAGKAAKNRMVCKILLKEPQK